MKKALLFFLFFLSFGLMSQAGDSPLSIPEIDGAQPVVCPNPAADYISLSSKVFVHQLVIYNFSGRQVCAFKATEGSKYNISKLPTGMYLVQFLDGKERILHTQRLQKR